MALLPTGSFMISFLATISTALGCGVMPAGQASTRNFNVTGFTLPVAMVYSTAADVQARVPGISTSVEGAKGFVERLVMQTIFDVLERQARSALLPDTVISTILGQLRVQISYEPMNCQTVVSPNLELMQEHVMKKHCIVASNTVTGICEAMQGAAGMMCMAGVRPVKIKNVPSSCLNNIRNSLDHQQYHGELDESDVAKCSEQSGSNVGVGSI
ncbi:hypothetical protein KIN20_037377 [Parelaphostrongylus tenuis]|uniref:Uncharacterized protein n=1 Tax=Parelaphostrongylus tenuis TaxID=148309 RepID=A0AAD5WM21_PARTN|nr:hypothetical protein KIN20_037377 [Parelaphostrongylus tenuis]